MDTLFEVDPERAAYADRLRALVAPVAASAGAVVDDPVDLAVANALWAAFGDLDASGGLTHAQLAHACRDVCDADTFESRFRVFTALGMLERFFDKAHQTRYVFNPTSAAGLMVFDRLGQRGGVDELITLLDRTRADLAAGRASVAQVRVSLRTAQRMLTISADHLLRLVSGSPLSELVAQRRHHSHNELIGDVQRLDKQVTEQFPELDQVMVRLVQEAQRYVDAREQFVTRLLDEGAAVRDFSLLDPEEYLQTARTASREALGQVFGTVVVDPPTLWLDPAAVAQLVADFTPRAPTRRRPPRPADPPPGRDPLTRVAERTAQATQRRLLAAELHLQGGDEADLTSALRAAGWPAAAVMVADAVAASRDPELQFDVSMRDELIVDANGPVTHVTPVILTRPIVQTHSATTDDSAEPDADIQLAEVRADA